MIRLRGAARRKGILFPETSHSQSAKVHMHIRILNRTRTLKFLFVALAMAIEGVGASAAPKASAENSAISTSLGQEGSHLIVEVKGAPPPAPVFFSATVEQMVRLGSAEIAADARIKLHVLQG